MNRNLLKIIMLAALLVAGVFGSTPAAAQSVTITYALWDNNQLPAHQQIVAAFEKENPNIKVDIQVVPWGNYWDKLQTAVAGGEAYDTFWMNGPNFPVYASKGVIADLKDRIAADSVDTSKYPEAMLNLYSYNGDLYGLPKDFDTIALFYNKDLFDAAGVAYPDDTWTWDDLAAAAAKLTKDDVWGFASTTADQSGFWNFVFANGGEVLSEDKSKVMLDQPAACDAIKYLYKFVADKTSPDGATTSAADPWTQLFPGGKIAMIVAGSWMSRTYADSGLNIDVAPLPKSPTTDKRATVIHGLANVMWSGTEHPDEAWAFVKFLGSETAANILAQSGTVIPAYTGYQQAWVEAIPQMKLQVFMDATSYAVAYPTAPQGTEWSAQVATVLNEVWAGNISIDDACSAATEAGNNALAAQ
ncbi:MAG: sugar ABC transporter substrate-binding protein [Anaerolineae bacterium]|nr:sugar ABC transporter substrate-binding protein [Anaerolineae bacterium]